MTARLRMATYLLFSTVALGLGCQNAPPPTSVDNTSNTCPDCGGEWMSAKLNGGSKGYGCKHYFETRAETARSGYQMQVSNEDASRSINTLDAARNEFWVNYFKTNGSAVR